MDPTHLQAIIFDFDGVLVESTHIKDRAFAELYADHGKPVADAVVEYHIANAGKSRYLKFRHAQEQILQGQPLTPAEETELDRRFSELVVDQVVKAPAVAGAGAILERFHKATPLFIASGTPEAELQRIVAERGMAEWFTAVRGSPATKSEIIADLLGQYRYSPDRVLMIGDAMSDYHGASKNAVRFIGRVAEGAVSPFPDDVATVPDLTVLEDAINHL